MKRCSKCNVKKEIDLFNRHKGSPDGHRSTCRECDKKRQRLYSQTTKEKKRKKEWRKNNRDKARESQYAWNRKNPSKLRAIQQRHKMKSDYKRIQRNYELMSKYGITVDDYEELIRSQNNKCKICMKSETTNRSLAVDHCHKSGAVRALLCFRCNTSIGQFEDSPDLLRKAAEYLEHHDDS